MVKLTRDNRFVLVVAIALMLMAGGRFSASAQSADSAKLRTQGAALFAAQNYVEALPVYEKLAKLFPKDPEIIRNLAFCLLGQSLNTEDAGARRALRIRARDTFIICRDLGDNSILINGLIDGLPPDGRDSSGYSDNAAANKLMEKAEGFFAGGKMDDALKTYQEALALDPRCYYAALFAGDVSTHTQRYDEAEKWYQRAISINPYIETAYRYSATPLMRQNKYEQARDRYIEAFIVAPYERLALSGILQWAQITETRLVHPKVDIPEMTIGPDGKTKTTLNVDPLADDGSMAWAAYAATREIWRTQKFATVFPKGTEYRHSLAEEADALRSVVSMAKTLKPKKLNPQIETIALLDGEGLLEAFILLAKPDDGIAADHPLYLKLKRDKLREYVLKHVIVKG